MRWVALVVLVMVVGLVVWAAVRQRRYGGNRAFGDVLVEEERKFWERGGGFGA